jgi:hypothetical protein
VFCSRSVEPSAAQADYRHFLVDLCAFGCGDYRDLCSSNFGPDALDQLLPQFAASALAGAHRKLLKRGRAFETLRQSERHRVKIALKKLRYAADFFGGLFDQERQARFSKSLARLQEDLTFRVAGCTRLRGNHDRPPLDAKSCKSCARRLDRYQCG